MSQETRDARRAAFAASQTFAEKLKALEATKPMPDQFRTPEEHEERTAKTMHCAKDPVSRDKLRKDQRVVGSKYTKRLLIWATGRSGPQLRCMKCKVSSGPSLMMKRTLPSSIIRSKEV